MSEPVDDDGLDDEGREELRDLREYRRSKWKPVALVALSLLTFPFRYVRILGVLGIVVAWFWMAYLLINSNMTFCPRCKKSMFVKGFWRSSLSDACLHCGLRIPK